MKKVLTVFLSIALVLAMIPGMAFAGEDTTLYCFDADNESITVSNGYLSRNDGKTLYPFSPEVIINTDNTFYFAIKDGNKYKAVKWADSKKCPITWSSDYVSCHQGGDDYEYKVSISKLSDNYKASYVQNGTTHTLTMECRLPYVGCYSSDTASMNYYLDSFKYSDDNAEFYVVSTSENTVVDLKYVKYYDGSESIDDKDIITGVDIKNTSDNKVKKVTVNKSAFNNTNKLEGSMVITYKIAEGNEIYTNSYGFEIYGPENNSSINTTLEASFGMGSYGKGCDIQAGKSKTVQFCVGKDDGSDMTFDTLIPATDKDFAVYDLDGNETSDIKLTPLADGKMEISASSSISPKTNFEIKYIGTEYELNTNNCFTVIVAASESAVKTIKASSITGAVAKAYKKNIKVSFKAMKNVDGYKIYRSTKKSSGYKLVKTVSKNSFTDTKSLKKGTRYYYKVRGYVKANDETYYSKYSKVVSAKSKVTTSKK